MMISRASFSLFTLADGLGELMGLPVMDLAEGKRTHRDALIVIAVMERHLVLPGYAFSPRISW